MRLTSKCSVGGCIYPGSVGRWAGGLLLLKAKVRTEGDLIP